MAINSEYPAGHALQKACRDSFQYLAHINGIGLVPFRSADDLGNGWYRLEVDWALGRDFGLPITPAPAAHDGKFPFPRGLDVQLSAVNWVADAPCGS